jgi:RsiW-degrading membrane proteinase PrsW (M82 family)
MPQTVSCSACSASFSAPDTLAGKSVRCPKCKQPIRIPAAANAPQPAPPVKPPAPKTPPGPDVSLAPSLAGGPKRPAADWDDDDFKLAPEVPIHPVVTGIAAPAPTAPPIQSQAVLGKSPPRRQLAKSIDEAPRRSSRQIRFIYWTFALTMLPLAFSLLGARIDYEERFLKTIEANPEVAEKTDDLGIDETIGLFPEGKLIDAHLARDSYVHWLYAVLSAAAFSAVIYYLFDRGGIGIRPLLITGLVTGTIGVLMLIVFQFIAAWSGGIGFRGRIGRGGGLILIVLYIIKFIGFSYSAALDPENGFLLSFLGYTCGVGFCEELIKVAPILMWLHYNQDFDWREACVLGLASGVGFGVAEGIMYSSQYYNGFVSFDTYLVRFISCVALHAVWTASAAVMVAHNQSGFETNEWTDWLVHMIMVIGVPVVLHGLYDTLLKKDLNAYALLTAVASFGWLIFMIERSRGTESDEEEGAELSYA